jgi:hypothetical protein
MPAIHERLLGQVPQSRKPPQPLSVMPHMMVPQSWHAHSQGAQWLFRQTFGGPPGQHSRQVPQSRLPPQPSLAMPHSKPSTAHVVGVQPPVPPAPEVAEAELATELADDEDDPPPCPDEDPTTTARPHAGAVAASAAKRQRPNPRMARKCRAAPRPPQTARRMRRAFVYRFLRARRTPTRADRGACGDGGARARGPSARSGGRVGVRAEPGVRAGLGRVRAAGTRSAAPPADPPARALRRRGLADAADRAIRARPCAQVQPRPSR